MIGPLASASVFLTSCDFGSTVPTAPAVRLIASDGTTAIARSTSGIVNMGGNTRGKLLTAPAAGWYIPLWDDNNGTPIPDEAVYVVAAVATVAQTSSVSTATPTDFYIKQHDTREPLTIQIRHDDNTVVDLTGVSTRRFLMRASGAGTPKVNNTVNITVTDAANGLVTYQWQTADTDTAGVYSAECEFTFSDGRILTAPTKDYLTIHVVADLGP